MGLSAIGLAVVGAIELGIALLTGSVALLGDALHNLSDVSTSAVVFAGFRLSRRPPNPRYPYGYERAEDLAGLGVALVIWASAGFAGFEAYRKFVGHGTTTQVALGLVGAALGIVANRAVGWYKQRVGRRINSVTLLADASHSRLDALSSAGAFVGLLLVAAHHPLGDPIAAFVVTLFILRVGYEVTSEVGHHLADGVDAEEVEAAQRAAAAVEGILEAVVRGRWMGRSLLLEIDVTVPAELNLASAQDLARAAGTAALKAVPDARRVRCTPVAA
jgi:cation diffusion facilitator family transporter